MYQLMFAIITPGLIVGAVAERMKYRRLMLFTWMDVHRLLPLAHMVWGVDGSDERRVERQGRDQGHATLPAGPWCTCRPDGRRSTLRISASGRSAELPLAMQLEDLSADHPDDMCTTVPPAKSMAHDPCLASHTPFIKPRRPIPCARAGSRR